MNLTPTDLQALMETLDACDDVIGACTKNNQEKQVIIELQDTQVRELHKRVIQLEKEGTSPIVYILIGVAGGLVLNKLIN